MGRRIKQPTQTLAQVADNIEEQARQDAAKRRVLDYKPTEAEREDHASRANPPEPCQLCSEMTTEQTSLGPVCADCQRMADDDPDSLTAEELQELAAQRARANDPEALAEARREYEAKVVAERKAQTDEMTFDITRTSADGRPAPQNQRQRAEKLIETIGEVLRLLRPDFETLEALVGESQNSHRYGGQGDDSIDLARWTDLRALKVSLGHAYGSLHHAQTSYKR